MVAKKRCFVIMPFSETMHHYEDYWKRHFESYLKLLIEKIEGLEVFRSEPLRGNIASQIITDLFNSDIVVADLTDHNPNVMWELGVRQSFKHGTITIAEIGTLIPFHFSHKGILFYHGSHLGNQTFEDDFLKSLRNCLEQPDAPDSPVLETLGGRGTLHSIIHADENKRKLDALRMEMDWTTDMFGRVSEVCKNNQALRSEGKLDECKAVTLRYFPTSALELLCVNRYLDLDEAVYANLQGYYALISAVNRKMEQWSLESEKWILDNKEFFDRFTKQINEALKQFK